MNARSSGPALGTLRCAGAAAGLLLASCVEKPLDGAPGGELGNEVTGYAPGPGWDVRVEAFDPATRRFEPVPLYDARGRATSALRASDEPAPESALLTPENDRDVLHRYAGFYDLPPSVWRFERARVRVVARAPGTTAFTGAFAYSSDAYHRCLVAGAETAFDLHDLAAHCADRESLVLERAPRRGHARAASAVDPP